ncbi:MAG: phosphonate C-P lyase system protein PhnL [Rhodospirillaceae bacterium TMED23]|jgi:alpha-D-ribose 1-methylphosphonate 5-triphosphate synthase subunit PhnL|nr:MAG: phosphonate C-P lyase system protein PhnL [Rhodospirillaceae bacterium TMED23]
MIQLRDVSKKFKLYNQQNALISVIENANLKVNPGECVALVGTSGSGKSTLMKMIYGNYLATSGSILVDGIDLTKAEPREILEVRKRKLGYVSQFLRVVPRVPSLKVVAEPLLSIGKPEAESLEIAEALLEELNIPRKLWPLSPTTFSGGEQQRVNIARGFSYAFPMLLLDEPTASLDKENRDIVISLINRAKSKGTAIVGIFHDQQARELICDREVDVRKFTPNLNGNDA